MSPESRRYASVQTVVHGNLVRACRPDRSAAKCLVGLGPVQEWIDTCQDTELASISHTIGQRRLSGENTPFCADESWRKVVV